MYFSANVSYASLPVFLPTILANMGYSNINAQGLSAPPYFVAFLFAIITTFIADRTQQRALVLVVTSIVGGVGYIVLATVTTVGVRYFAVYLAAAGVFSTIPNILAWTLSIYKALISLPARIVEANPSTRQPRQRYTPWCGACHDQPHRTVRPSFRNTTLPQGASSTVRRGDEHLRRFHVLHYTIGSCAANSLSMGEWQAR